MDDVYPVGVYARIGGSFPVKSSDGGETFILYPTHRIKIGDMVPPVSESQPSKVETEAESSKLIEPEADSKEETISDALEITADPDSDVTSFEKDNVSKRELAREELYKIPVSWSSGVSDLEDLPYDPHSEMISALTAEILRILKELSVLNRPLKDQVVNLVLAGNKFTTSNVYEEPHILADFAASVSAGRAKEIQDVLSSLNIEERLQKALILVKRELINIQLQEKISADVDNKIQKRQREYFLMEQLKGIKRELGMDDGREKLIQTFRDRAAKLSMPESVLKVFDDEINKLMTLEPVAAEYNVTRQYLDWITQIPWGKYSKDSYNIKNAMSILDEDHYGLKDVKDRILEFIAVGKLLGTVDGKIVCFVGPPGVGKTSVAKSIAKALNRKFYRFSIGGVSDVSELKGHRRTYVGALPGRIVQALKKTQTQNPLILIDEIDKIGRAGYHGDPSAALLELLDPEQNSSFLDHYMDVPIDMSKTLFVCTANSLDTIPGPLLDRMEVIEISGYVADEKIAIAEKYLAPSAKKLAGLESANVTLTHEAIEGIISKYARESGVRNLKKQIEKIYRKAALNIIKKVGEDQFVEETTEDEVTTSKQDDTATIIPNGDLPTSDGLDKPSSINATTEASEPVSAKLSDIINDKALEATNDAKSEESVEESSESISADEEPQTVLQHKPLHVPDDISIEITPGDLKDYIGPPVYIEDRMYEKTPIGVVMGLGVTSMGGSTLYVESVLEQPLSIDSHAGMSQTGQLGSTMKESSTIAYSFSRMFIGKNFPENRFFERAKIHLHCPEGAIPKDGPSAGITMATSLLSLALNEPLEPTIAMTGELTLTGKVLRIGGLREKSVAAKRSGAKTIFFPKDNLSDWEAMPDNVKEGLEPVPVSWYGEVFDRAFSHLDHSSANRLWQRQFERIDAAKRDISAHHPASIPSTTTSTVSA